MIINIYSWKTKNSILFDPYLMQNTKCCIEMNMIIKMRLQSHYKETVYLQPFGAQEFLVLTWTTSKGWKLSIKAHSGCEAGTPVVISNFFWRKVLLMTWSKQYF